MLPDEGYESGSDQDSEYSEWESDEEGDEEFWDAVYEDLIDASDNMNTNQPQ